jgi:hypothetical protein
MFMWAAVGVAVINPKAAFKDYLIVCKHLGEIYRT